MIKWKLYVFAVNIYFYIIFISTHTKLEVVVAQKHRRMTVNATVRFTLERIKYFHFFNKEKRGVEFLHLTYNASNFGIKRYTAEIKKELTYN